MCDSVGKERAITLGPMPHCSSHREVTCPDPGEKGGLGTRDPLRIGLKIESSSCSGHWLWE